MSDMTHVLCQICKIVFVETRWCVGKGGNIYLMANDVVTV